MSVCERVCVSFSACANKSESLTACVCNIESEMVSERARACVHELQRLRVRVHV